MPFTQFCVALDITCVKCVHFGYGYVFGFGYGARYVENCPAYRNILVYQRENVIRVFSNIDYQIGVRPQNRVVQGEPLNQ